MSSRRGSVMVAAGILASRVSGLVRESVIAAFLGRSFATDAYTAAMRIPNFLQNLLGEGVLSASFIPVYARLLAEGRDQDAGRVAGAIAGLLVALTGALVLLGVVLAGPLTQVIAGGFSGERHDLTVLLVRITFPGVGFLVLSAWCLGVLNSHRHFFLSYVAPVLWNSAQIAVLLGVGVWLLGGLPAGDLDDELLARFAVALAVGTLAGGILQFAVQLPTVLRLAPRLRWSLRTDLPGVRTALGAFAPVVAGRGVVQLSAFVDTLLASFLAVGALAALRYGQTLYLLPIALFGMSVAAAELPVLSTLSPDDRTQLTGRLDDGLARIAFFVLPTVAVYLVAGDVIVATLFERGAFDELATRLVWLVLAGYAIGLPATTASRLLQSTLYGVGAPQVPAKVSVARVALSAVLGVALMLQLDRVAVTSAGLALVGDLPAFAPLPEAVRAGGAGVRLGALGLALAAGLSAWLEWALLRRGVRRRLGPMRLGGGRLWRTAAAAAVAGGTGLLVRPVAAGWPDLLATVAILGAAGAAYLVAAVAFGALTWGELRAAGRGLSRR